MAEEMTTKQQGEEVVEATPAPKKEKKAKDQKPNFFVRAWKKTKKFFTDVANEMKKVVWTPKAELSKNTKLVIVTVVAVAVVIALVDLGASALINAVAGLVG